MSLASKIVRKKRIARYGSGEGGGVLAIPLGVFEITGTQTRFILHDKRRTLAGAVARVK